MIHSAGAAADASVVQAAADTRQSRLGALEIDHLIWVDASTRQPLIRGPISGTTEPFHLAIDPLILLIDLLGPRLVLRSNASL